MNPAIRLHDRDQIAVALMDLGAGDVLFGVPLAEPILRGHKFALQAIAQGELVRRYGQIIGRATQPIDAGAHVHGHNLAMAEHASQSDEEPYAPALPPADPGRHFLGYRRADGRVGTRNYVGIVTTVNCAGSVAKFVAEAAERSDWLRQSGIDGVVPIVHGNGCAMDRDGEGYETLARTLSGYVQHPNFGGILLLGLGCETMQIPDLVGRGVSRTDRNFHAMVIQEEGGTAATVARGLEALKQVVENAAQAKREPVPLSHLTIGMQCGGSDGFSGITANPALGYASDLLVAHGGTTILSETPEIYGAEHLLTRRAVSSEVRDALLARIAWWEDYAARNGGQMDNNPSPGNKRGGLTTILEKSLGAVAKGGMAPLSAVYKFAEPIRQTGFVFMDSPGYDPVSVTGQIASGANLIVFTTGRGSVSGFKPSPGIKVATNSDMYRRMQGDMDIDCGPIAEGSATIEEKGREIFEAMIATASGQPTKSEALGFGGAEFVPWQIGAVM